jgi:type II secretory pathway component GspD/PulD (secretin)
VTQSRLQLRIAQRAPRIFLAVLLTLAPFNPLPAQQSAKKQAAVTSDDTDTKQPPSDPKAAKQSYLRGREAEKSSDWRAAFEAYSQATNLSPGNKEYDLRRALARSRLVQDYVDRAERDAVANRMLQARAELSAAIALDPGDEAARERWRELSPQETIIKDDRPDSLASPVQLEPQPGTRTFDLKGSTQQAYQAVAKEFGVKVSFDVDLRTRNVRLRLADVTFQTAMKVLGPMTGTFWKPLGKNLFFVADDNPQKRRDYDTSIVRTIILPASSTPEDATEMLRVIREVTGITRTQLDSRNHTITLRANPQSVALATTLIQDLEQPRGQLILDVDILEIDRDNARNLGITPPQTGQIFSVSKQEVQEAQSGLSGLVTVLEQVFGTPSGLSGLTSNQVGGLLNNGQVGLGTLIPPLIVFGGGASTFLSTLPGATANFSTLLSTVRSGQRVRLRAEDGHPATFFVGDRIPVSYAQYSSSLTSSLNIPGVGGSNFPISTLATGTSPISVATGILRASTTTTPNADLFQDLIVANNGDNTVSVFLGNGDGTFGTGTTFMTGNGPTSVATGNFNADANLDVVTTNATDDTVSILLGNGDGTLAAKQDFPVGKSPVSVAVADFNADGKADLVVANQADNTISVLLGNGDGTFQPQQVIGAGSSPTQVITGDFNADGKIDIAVVNQNLNTVSIYLGKGDGTFPTRTDYPTGNQPVSLATGDLNGDGVLDLAVANKTDDTISVLLGNGDGTFGLQTPYQTTSGPVSVTIADYNIDGRPDLAVAEQGSDTVSILLGLGSGIFAPPFDLPVGTSPASVTSTDFNSDGLPDLAIANQGANTATVIINSSAAAAALTNSGTGNFGTPYPGVEYLDLGVKLKVTPRMHPNNEVTLQASLEIRSLTGQSLNQLPIISNRTIEQTVRLRENETSLLAGYMNVQGTRSLNGWPGISELEGIGSLIGGTTTDESVDEVLILITPRRLNPVQRTERLLFAGHAPAQGAGSVGATFEEQPNPNQPPAPLVAPGPENQPSGEPPPQPITVPPQPQPRPQ